MSMDKAKGLTHPNTLNCSCIFCILREAKKLRNEIWNKNDDYADDGDDDATLFNLNINKKIVNPVPGFQHHFCLFLFFTNFFHSLLSLLRLILFPHFSLTISFYWVIWCLLKYLLLLVLPPAYFVFKLFLYFMCLSLSFNLSESVCFSLSLSQYIFLFALSMSRVPI